MAGRYTAQHLYGSAAYQQADSGATHPYTTSAYRCPWSQRGYLFQFDSYQQRAQFDAANTSCCDEPIRPFDRKPQYADQWSPPRVSDCEAKKKDVRCNVEKLDNGTSPCASSTGAGNHTGVRVKCPNDCGDLIKLRGGETVRALYGEFQFAQDLGNDLVELRYVPDASKLQAAWNNCEGMTWVEMLCDQVPITIAINAGPTKPNGCDCDCCGNIPIAFDLSTEGCTTESGGYGNQAYCPDAWLLTPGCSGQGESLDLYVSGVLHASWEVIPDLAIYEGWWALSGVPGYIGDADQPACCGLSGEVEFARGCAADWGTSGVTLSTKKPTLYTAIFGDFQYGGRYYYHGAYSGGVSTDPADGPCSGYTICYDLITIPYTSVYERFISGYQACAWSNKAALGISGWSGLAHTYGDMTRHSGYVARSLGIMSWDTFRDGQCCGFGRMMVDFNNGCDDEDHEPVYIRHDESDNAASAQIGHALKCTYSGSMWVIEEAQLYCDGHTGSFTSGISIPVVPYPTTLEECNAALYIWDAGSGNPLLDYSHYLNKGCRATVDVDCCFVSRSEAVSGEDYRVYIWQGMGTDKCCPNVPRAHGYYVREAADCCPAKTGEPWM